MKRDSVAVTKARAAAIVDQVNTRRVMLGDTKSRIGIDHKMGDSYFSIVTENGMTVHGEICGTPENALALAAEIEQIWMGWKNV